MLAQLVLIATLAAPVDPGTFPPVTTEMEWQHMVVEQVQARTRIQTHLLREVAVAEAKRIAAERAAAAQAAREAEARRAAAYSLPLSLYRITARFGDCGTLWARCHTGLDLAAPTGTRVSAVKSGRVVFAGRDGPYGNKVVVRHADGSEATYAHLSRITQDGGSVGTGEKVGEVGATGHATGPHLHLEIRDGGLVDPARWLARHGVRL